MNKDLIETIYRLNDLIDKNNNYMTEILKKDKKNHNNNFKNLNEIKEVYDKIIDIYQSNYENNEYLFKCIFDITIKYLSNISGFYIYLNLFYQYKYGIITTSDLINIYKKIKEEIGFEKQNYTSMLDILNMDKILSISNIRNIEILITPVDASLTLSSNNMNISKINNLMIYLKNLMFKTIINIIDLDDKTNENSSNFITIPQYTSMCVYISMLTGICYSDLNKALIKQSQSQSKNNYFKEFINYIITNITNNYKKYDSISSTSDCVLLDFLKYEPYNILNKMTIDIFNKIFLANYKKTSEIFIDNNVIKISKDIYEDFINYLELNYFYSKYAYFIDLINMNLKENGLYYELHFDFKNDYKMSGEDMRFLIYLYELLDIKAKHIYSNDKDIYFEYKNERIEKDEEEPDILILQKNFNKLSFNPSFIQIMKDKTLIIKNDGIIIFNGFIYKLDYILHYNDIEKCNNSKCYHCISAITYNNEDYIYNSDIKSDIISCDNGEDYTIPCSLLKQNWNKNINKDITYCTTKCKYNLKCKIENVYDKNLCYSFNTNIIYVYVKL